MYVVTIDGFTHEYAYTSLTRLCKEVGVPYSRASKGERDFLIKSKCIRIKKVTIKKITGRGRQFK